MKKIKVSYRAYGEIEIEVGENDTTRDITDRFDCRVGFSEDDLYNNIEQFSIEDYVTSE